MSERIDFHMCIYVEIPLLRLFFIFSCVSEGIETAAAF